MTRTLFPDAVITGEVLEHLRLRGIERYELVEGRIVPLTPTNREHARGIARLCALLTPLMPRWQILAGDPGVYVRRRPDTVRGPDVIAISDERYRQSDPARAFLTVVPELVIEIISPSNEEEDIARKAAEYVAIGARVWVVDLDGLTVTVSDQAGNEVVDGRTDDRLILPNGAEVFAREVVG